MIRDEQKFLNRVAVAVDKAIDRIFDKEGLDRAYFNFNLTCSILDSSLTGKLAEYTLIDDNEGFCCFCGVKSLYHSPLIDANVCPECLRKYVEAGITQKKSD